jgi:hypothetical protein
MRNLTKVLVCGLWLTMASQSGAADEQGIPSMEDQAFNAFSSQVLLYKIARKALEDPKKATREDIKLRHSIGYLLIAAVPADMVGSDEQEMIEELAEIAKKQVWTPAQVKLFQELLKRKFTPIESQLIQLWGGYYYQYILHNLSRDFFAWYIDYFEIHLGAHSIEALIGEGDTVRRRTLFGLLDGEVAINRIVDYWESTWKIGRSRRLK